MVAKWVGVGGSLLLLILLAALAAVSGLQRMARAKGAEREELEPELEPELVERGFSREAEAVVASDFAALKRRVHRREPSALPPAARLRALEEREGPMPDFIRDLFGRD